MRTRVTVSPAVGSSTRQVSFFAECFAEVMRATSLNDEESANFTVAQQLRRLGSRVSPPTIEDKTHECIQSLGIL